MHSGYLDYRWAFQTVLDSYCKIADREGKINENTNNSLRMIPLRKGSYHMQQPN